MRIDDIIHNRYNSPRNGRLYRYHAMPSFLELSAGLVVFLIGMIVARYYMVGENYNESADTEINDINNDDLLACIREQVQHVVTKSGHDLRDMVSFTLFARFNGSFAHIFNLELGQDGACFESDSTPLGNCPTNKSQLEKIQHLVSAMIPRSVKKTDSIKSCKLRNPEMLLVRGSEETEPDWAVTDNIKVHPDSGFAAEISLENIKDYVEGRNDKIMILRMGSQGHRWCPEDKPNCMTNMQLFNTTSANVTDLFKDTNRDIGFELSVIQKSPEKQAEETKNKQSSTKSFSTKGSPKRAPKVA